MLNLILPIVQVETLRPGGEKGSVHTALTSMSPGKDAKVNTGLTSLEITGRTKRYTGYRSDKGMNFPARLYDHRILACPSRKEPQEDSKPKV